MRQITEDVYKQVLSALQLAANNLCYADFEEAIDALNGSKEGAHYTAQQSLMGYTAEDQMRDYGPKP